MSVRDCSCQCMSACVCAFLRRSARACACLRVWRRAAWDAVAANPVARGAGGAHCRIAAFHVARVVRG
eukprot:3400565-Lingulodinium_polyedra.AAC.1